MLTSITINNYALIKQLNINFSDGLNVITGETGAGKSIIIDALSLLLGERAVRDNIRSGEKKMTVSALFDISDLDSVKNILQENGIEIENDQLVLSREVDRKSRNVCRANGTIVPLTLFKEIGLNLVDIHSQHENILLFKPENQRKLLDAYSGEAEKVLDELRELTKALRELALRIRELQKTGKEKTREYAINQFEFNEIQKADLKENEEEELIEDRKTLEKGEKIYQNALEAQNMISNDDYESISVSDLLSDLIGKFTQMAKEDTFFNDYLKSLERLENEINSISYDLSSYLDKLDYDPEKLSNVHSRLNEIDGLKKKYGDSIKEILDYAEELNNKLSVFDNQEDLLKEAKQNYSDKRNLYNEKAKELSKIRNKSAEKLKKDLESELKDLAMEKAQVVVDINTDTDVISGNGQDSVDFLISVNPGIKPQSLKKVASGGEISRIMLALKVIFGDKDEIGTSIFDEIDTGISGRTAQTVAEKIQNLSENRQVICITHLPQIAAMADSQFLVTKVSDTDLTEVNFSELDKEGRVLQLAKMLGGAQVTDTTLKSANEMIEQAEIVKNKT